MILLAAHLTRASKASLRLVDIVVVFGKSLWAHHDNLLNIIFQMLFTCNSFLPASACDVTSRAHLWRRKFLQSLLQLFFFDSPNFFFVLLGDCQVIFAEWFEDFVLFELARPAVVCGGSICELEVIGLKVILPNLVKIITRCRFRNVWGQR